VVSSGGQYRENRDRRSKRKKKQRRREKRGIEKGSRERKR